MHTSFSKEYGLPQDPLLLIIFENPGVSFREVWEFILKSHPTAKRSEILLGHNELAILYKKI
jgi:hypothetical protein